MTVKRAVREHDIARMSAMKSAIELVAAFPDKIKAEGHDGLITTCCKVAEQIYEWVLTPPQGEEQEEEERANWHDLVLKECHELQKKLHLKATDWDKDPCPWGDWHEGGADELLKMLRERAKNGSEAGSFTGDVEESGYRNPSTYEPGRSKNDYPLSSKQFGFLVGLHKKAGLEYSNAELNALSSRDASGMIDKLLEITEGNGDGKQRLADIKGQIKDKVKGIRSQL